MGNPSPSDEHAHEHDGESCPACWAHLSTPLFCETCEAPVEPGRSPTPFETLGLQPEYGLDKMTLRKRLLALSRRLHPDYYGNADATTRERAQRNTAELNAAFEILSDDFRRADWIVKSLGGPDENEERQMPPEFLAEVLEWNEAVEEARGADPGSPERAALDRLRDELAREREERMSEISELLTPLPEAHAPGLNEIRKRLNTIRYLDRTLRQILELQLDLAANTP